MIRHNYDCVCPLMESCSHVLFRQDAPGPEYYDANPVYYSPLADPDRSLRALARAVSLPLEEPLLDLGCGDGIASGSAVSLGVSYLGVDYSLRRLRRARRYNPLGWFLHEDIGTFMRRRHRPGAWGTIVLVEVLEHLRNPLGAIVWARIAGRNVLATVPIDLADPAHRWVFDTPEDAERLFAPTRSAVIGGHVVMAWDGWDAK